MNAFGKENEKGYISVSAEQLGGECQKVKNRMMTDIEIDIVHLPRSYWKEYPAEGRPPHHCVINFSTS